MFLTRSTSYCLVTASGIYGMHICMYVCMYVCIDMAKIVSETVLANVTIFLQDSQVGGR